MMDFSFKDAKRLCSSIWYKEELVNEKRRWLMWPHSKGTCNSRSKKLKKVKCTRNRFLAESCVRSVQNYSHAAEVKARTCSSLSDAGEKLHEIKNHVVLPDANMESLVALQHLSEFLTTRGNNTDKQLTFPTFARSSLGSSIAEALESLDLLPIAVLVALNRKLTGKTAIPKFPPSRVGYKKEVIVDRIRKKIHKLNMSVQNGESTQDVLMQALSLITLFCKERANVPDTLSSKVLPFSKETVDVQNDILKALWSLPYVAPYQIKALRAALGLDSETCSNGFLNDLKLYLIQYLFECDEIDVPIEVLDVLSIINRSSCRRPQTRSKELISEVPEAVLNVSCELMQILSDLCSSTLVDESRIEGLERDDGGDSNDFELDEKDYCSTPGVYHKQKKNLSVFEGVEATGDSMCVTNSNSSFGAPKSIVMRGSIKKENPDDIRRLQAEPIGVLGHTSRRTPEDGRYVSIREICDEASLICHGLVGSMLDGYLLGDGEDVDSVGRDRLTVEALF